MLSLPVQRHPLRRTAWLTLAGWVLAWLAAMTAAGAALCAPDDPAWCGEPRAAVSPWAMEPARR